MGKVMVSIICNTYNHEKYIRDALESFVMQKTNFTFEVLVHDDASTDNTAMIIREYEAKYPDLIKPIYQKENQYSQGIYISIVYQYPRAKGEYIAICEGDDYWTDPLKLQKQYDLMEMHHEVDICAHTSKVVEANTGRVRSLVQPLDHTGIIPTLQVIKGGGGFVSTNSLMMRSSLTKNIPKFRNICEIDYTIQVHGSLRGGMLFIADEMSVYRANVNNSWVDRMKKSKKSQIAHANKMIKMYRQMDIDTERKYHCTISRLQLKQALKIAYLKVRSLL